MNNKCNTLLLARVCVFFVSIICLQGCFSIEGPSSEEESPEGISSGTLVLAFDEEAYLAAGALCDIPDSNDFFMHISTCNSVIYEGLYGAAPEKIAIPADSVLIRASPTDDTAQQADMAVGRMEQSFAVPADSCIFVNLKCVQDSDCVGVEIIEGKKGSGMRHTGSSKTDAMSIYEAKNAVGSKGVWVYGYIVGGDLSNSKTGMKIQSPFSAATNLAIARKSSSTDKSVCLSVQLPSGDARDALNLATNPGNLHRQVFLKGDIVSSYFGIIGIKNLKDWEISPCLNPR